MSFISRIQQIKNNNYSRVESFFVDKNWFYTAITRARNLDDVYFMLSDKQSEDTEYKLLRTYFIDKKEGCIQHDYKKWNYNTTRTRI